MRSLRWFWYVINTYYVFWTFLPKELRYLGPRRGWYDGPYYEFGLWFGHFYILDKYWVEDDE